MTIPHFEVFQCCGMLEMSGCLCSHKCRLVMTNEGLKGCLISQEDIYTITPCNSDLSNWKWD